MIRFTRESESPLIVVTKETDLPKAPFAATLPESDKPWRRCRVLSIEERPNGFHALTIRALFEFPEDGALAVAPESKVRLEKVPGGFRAFLNDGGAATSSNILALAAAQALFLADLYGCGDPILGEDIPPSIIEEEKRHREIIERYREIVRQR